MAPPTSITPTLFDEWRSRRHALAILAHRGEPEGWQWLCGIRIRILDYLIAR